LAIRGKDEKLVARCLRGDERAWTDLWLRYGPLVKAVARRAGCTNDEAQDVLQQVALVALEKLESLRERHKLPGWLAGIARYRAYELVRRRTPGDDHELDRLTDPVLHEEVLARDQQLALLRSAFVQLDQRCQRLVQALDLDEPPQSYREVAANEELSPTSIGPIRRRCLNRLKKIFESLSRSGTSAHYMSEEG